MRGPRHPITALWLGLLAGTSCTTVEQPKVVLQSSLAAEILLAGPLDQQPAGGKKKDKSRYEELVKKAESDDPRVVEGVKKYLLGLFHCSGEAVKLESLIPKIEGESISPDGSVTYTVPEVGLTNGWSQMAGNEESYRKWRGLNLVFAVQLAMENAARAEQDLTLELFAAEKLGEEETLERMKELGEKRQGARAAAEIRLQRLQELFDRKAEVLAGSEKQARRLAENQRLITDHHLQLASGLSVDALRYRYELYKDAFDRQRERIEKAFEEGEKESEERRKRIESAKSLLDAAREAVK